MRRSQSKSFDEQVYERQVSICKAFANATRLQILDLMTKGPCKGADLQKRVGISKANLSQHLSVLRAAGVIVTTRDGNQIYCSLALPEVKEACERIRSVLRAQIRTEKRLAV